jgi:hypothetical protein
VQLGQLREGFACEPSRHGPRAVGDRGPARREILEQHQERPVGSGGREGAARHAQRQRRRDLVVEVHLARAHAGGADAHAMRRIARRQLAEERVGGASSDVVGEAEAEMVVGALGGVEDGD